MYNEDIAKLIKKFEENIEITDNMLMRITEFKDVLLKYYESYKEFKELSEYFEEENIMENIMDIEGKLKALCHNSQNAINEVSTGMNNLLSLADDNNEKIEKNIISVNESLDNAKELKRTLDSISSVIDNLKLMFESDMKDKATSINEKLSELENRYETIMNTYEHIDNKIGAIINSFESQLKELSMKQDKTINTVNDILNNTLPKVIESNNSLSKHVENLVNENIKLNKIIEELLNSNIDMEEAFTEIADKWGSTRIRGWSFVKK